MKRDRMKIVVPFSGSPASSAAVALLVDQGHEVVTLTLDVGQTEALDGIRARALEAGAVRAHVVDARETFVRACVLPAMQAPGGVEIDALAGPLIATTLAEIASIEGGDAMPPSPGDHPRHLLMRPVADPSRALDAEARLDITLENGVPVAINDVPMTLVELVESVSLIAGQHGIAAAVILRAVYAHASEPSATVRLTLHKGRYTVAPRATASVVAQ